MSEKKYNVIAIDGPSGSGKGTTAKGVAKKLGWIHLDAGSFYRAIAFYMYYVQDVSASSVNEEHLNELTLYADESGISMNGKKIEEFLRTNLIDDLVPHYGKNKKVRAFVKKLLLGILSQYNCVIEGRVTTSVICPNAKYKFFLTCSIEERAIRRARQRKITDPEEISKLRQKIAQRDFEDTNREIEPLVQVPEAIVVETDHMSIEEQIEEICSHVKT